MTSSRDLLTQLPSLYTHYLGPPCMSTILELLQTKEAGALSFLSSLCLHSMDTPEAGTPALLLLFEWMQEKHKQGESVCS